ncbi:putative transcription factor SSXT family [Lupinus albus]|uniref:Putative transcription factor SSXT family n=1 Tax=Lupinus albus TaxID=3870 RepID=A0A6A4PS19_LUPAL|nr:putative transcription factor SSXT family [Lupinus albus]
MFNNDPSLNNISTEMIQKYLEENKELILAALEGQNMGKFAEAAQYQAKLQQNLSYLAKLADAVTLPQIEPQGQAMQQPHVAISQQQPHVAMPQQQSHVAMSQQHPHLPVSQQQPHIAMSQQQPELSTLNLPFDLNDQQEHNHLAISLQQRDLSAPKLPFQMNEQQHKLPDFFQQQQQFMPGQVGSFPSPNSGIYQTLPTRLGNLSHTPESSQIGSDVSPLWSLGMPPSGPY